MKGLLLLIGSFLLFSFQLFGIEENCSVPGYPSDDCPVESIEKITPALSPTPSPAIIPDSPRVFGEQTGSDHSYKAKASFIDVQNFFSPEFLPVPGPDWRTRPSAKESLFILFRNLRL